MWIKLHSIKRIYTKSNTGNRFKKIQNRKKQHNNLEKNKRGIIWLNSTS